MKIRHALYAFLLMLFCAITAQAQLSVYSGQALHNQNVSGGIVVSAPIPNGQVRVCTTPVSGMTPCANPASIFDINGNPIGVPTGFFGQLATSVTGFFSFQCSSGVYEIQIAPSTSNTPALDYLAACPLTTGGAGVTGTGLTVLQTGPTINNPILNSPSFIGVTTFTNPTINGATLAGTFSGNPLFSGSITVPKLDNVEYVDGNIFACSSAGITAAISALPSTGGTVDARGCLGTEALASTVTLSIPVKLILGAATWTAAACPAFDLTSEGAELNGQSPGEPTGTAAPTVIKAGASCSGPLVRMNIAAGAKGGVARYFQLDGNSKQGSVTAGIEMGPTAQVNRNIVDSVSFTQLTTGLLLDAGAQSHRYSFLHMQNVNTGVDMSAGQMTDISFSNSRFVCDTLPAVIGTDDTNGANISNGVHFYQSDLTLNSNGTGVAWIRNAIGVEFVGGWLEVSTGKTMTQNAAIQIGDASSAPQEVSIRGNLVEMNNNSGERAVEIISGFYHTIMSNAFEGVNAGVTPVKVTSTNSSSSVVYNAGFGASGLQVDSTIGLIQVTGNSNPASDLAIFPQGIKLTGATSGSFTLTATATGGTLNLGSNATLTSAGALTVVSCTGCGGGGSTAFSGITAGTNTTAAMLVGSGGTLGVTGSGTIDATTLGGATFVSPGAIGSTTPGTGAFTSLSSTGIFSNSQAGALSAASVSITGAPITGGSGTTTFPLVYLNSGAAPTTFATTGTMLGMNSPSGFGGNFLDFHFNGAGSAFSVTAGGNVVAAGTFAVSGTSSVRNINNGSINHLLYSVSAPTISSGFGGTPSIANNNGSAAFTVNVGTGAAASSGVIGMPTSTGVGWACSVNDLTSRATGTATSQTYQTATSTTTVTITNQTISTGAAVAWAASDIVQLVCFPY